jgi:hypothetical protein
MRKKCAENAKISGSVREKTHTTQHDRTDKEVCVFGRESKKLVSRRGTYSSGRHAVRYEIDRAELVWTQEHVHLDASH